MRTNATNLTFVRLLYRRWRRCKTGTFPPPHTRKHRHFRFLIMFDFTSLTLAFAIGFLASIGIHFLIHRTNIVQRWQRRPSSPGTPSLINSDEKKTTINSFFPNAMPNFHSMPPPQFYLPPQQLGIPPPPIPLPFQYCDQYVGESFGSYRRVHQRLTHLNNWEASRPEPPNIVPFAFTVFYRHKPPRYVPSTDTLVEIHSDGLKKVLRNCLQFVDSVYDPTPLV